MRSDVTAAEFREACDLIRAEVMRPEDGAQAIRRFDKLARYFLREHHAMIVTETQNLPTPPV
jgi:hypothetical protein